MLVRLNIYLEYLIPNIKNHFELIVIMCPTIFDNNKAYLSRKWIFDDKNVFIVCDVEGKLNEWIKNIILYPIKDVREQLKWLCLFFTKDRDNFKDCLRENDVIPDKNEWDRLKKSLQNKLYSKLILKCYQPAGYIICCNLL